MTESFIQIVDTRDQRRFITIIEVLSPSNKTPGNGRRLYRRKQEECVESNTNLVEIALLRAGLWTIGVPKTRVRRLATYRVCVFEAMLARCAYYAIDLKQKLPTIAIPLRPGDDNVRLNLQSLIDECYKNGGYDGDIDYEVEAEPPLKKDDAKWADALLCEHGLRAREASKKSAGNGKRSCKPNQ